MADPSSKSLLNQPLSAFKGWKEVLYFHEHFAYKTVTKGFKLFLSKRAK